MSIKSVICCFLLVLSMGFCAGIQAEIPAPVFEQGSVQEQQPKDFMSFIELAIDRNVLTTDERILFDKTLEDIKSVLGEKPLYVYGDGSASSHRLGRAVACIMRCHLLTRNHLYDRDGFEKPLSYRDVQGASVYCLAGIWESHGNYKHDYAYLDMQHLVLFIQARYGKSQAMYPWVKRDGMRIVMDVDLEDPCAQAVFDNYLEVFACLRDFDKGRKAKGLIETQRNILRKFFSEDDKRQSPTAAFMYGFVISKLHEFEDRVMTATIPDVQATKDAKSIIRQGRICMLHHQVLQDPQLDQVVGADQGAMPIVSVYKQVVKGYIDIVNGDGDTADQETQKREQLFVVTMALVRVEQYCRSVQPSGFDWLRGKTNPRAAVALQMHDVLYLIQSDLAQNDPDLVEKAMKVVAHHLVPDDVTDSHPKGLWYAVAQKFGKSPLIKTVIEWVAG